VNPIVLTALLVVAAYLTGAIPFGYLIAKAAKGIDIRTVGSGNIGATNVGRTLGFRFFILVFLLDVAKGLLPTLFFPRFGSDPAGLPERSVLVALATILGHNFPIYLGFKGGKGVATSLGALLALDPVAGFSASAGFGLSLLVTRFVSLSSIVGGLVFVVAHFLRISAPWAREQRAMSLLTICLFGLLVARHRKNLGRIAAGTEPRVASRKYKSQSQRGGCAASWVIGLAVFGIVAAVAATLLSHSTRPAQLTIGHHTLTEVARVGTGHQRAERVAFAAGGRLLAVTCPRYNRVVLYRVTYQHALERLNELTLDGKPVALSVANERLYVLERPAGDKRHVEPGWLEVFDLSGRRVGGKAPVGFYPDDLAISPDARLAFVLTSGRAEGDAKKPAPALDVYDLSSDTRLLGKVTFDAAHDDPARLTLSSSGRGAVVTLAGSDMAAAIDLFDPAQPRLIGRTPLARVEQPYLSRTTEDRVVMPVASGREALVVSLPGIGECLVATLPHDSGLEFSLAEPSRALGRLTLHTGTFGLGTTRPTGLAFSPERGLLAVANRSGCVHLVALRSVVETPSESLAAREINNR
jgi:glycerol-3-phosphate acyltransferase PlsY